MNKLIVASVSLLTLAVAQPASSADTRPMMYKATVPAAYTWSGCYFGPHFGGLWAINDWTDRTTGTTAFGKAFGGQEAKGYLGGIQTGCNYQLGQLVFGMEADYAWADANGSNADLIRPGLADGTHVKSLATATARVGYAWDRLLAYVKGGAAGERDNYTFYVRSNGAIISAASDQRRGWTVGAGAEFAFTNNITAFIEYDYHDFGTHTNTFVTVVSVFDRTVDIREHKSVVKAGFNFKVDWQGAALTKY